MLCLCDIASLVDILPSDLATGNDYSVWTKYVKLQRTLHNNDIYDTAPLINVPDGK